MSVSAAKLAGMRAVLARDGEVRFKATGAVMRWDAEVDLLVTFPDGEQRRVNEWSSRQFEAAYEIAMYRPEPRVRPWRRPPNVTLTGDGSKFGDDPPF